MQGRVYGLEGGVARADGDRAEGRRALRVRRIPPQHACELEPQQTKDCAPAPYSLQNSTRWHPRTSLPALVFWIGTHSYLFTFLEPRPTGPTTSTRLASSLSFLLLVPSPAQLSNPSPFGRLPQRPSPPGPRRPDRTGSSPLSSGSSTTTERRSRCDPPPLLSSLLFISRSLSGR